MTRQKFASVTLIFVVATVAVLAPGCKSAKKEVAPKAVEATVQVAPPAADKIEFIDVNPWTIKPGEKAEITLAGTADRSASVTLTGLDGQATGKSQTVSLTAKAPGQYAATVVADDRMPSGKYRIEGVLAGGPAGEPVRLVSSRSLTVAAPPPPPVDACVEAGKLLATPKIYFAYDKSNIDDAGMAWIKEVAAKISGLGGRATRVTVEGHCDERGTVEYNLALGGRRATAVKNALSELPGMAGVAMETLSKGEEEPVVRNAATEEDHARNRRAVILLECAAR